MTRQAIDVAKDRIRALIDQAVNGNPGPAVGEFPADWECALHEMVRDCEVTVEWVRHPKLPGTWLHCVYYTHRTRADIGARD